MRGTTLAVLAMVALMLVPMQAFALVSGQPNLDATTGANSFAPGETGKLTITLSNAGTLGQPATDPKQADYNAEVTEARAVKATLDPNGAPITLDGDAQVVPKLPSGQSAAVPYQLTVSDHAKPGTYHMDLNVEYRYTSSITTESSNGVREYKTDEETFDVTIRVKKQAQFEVVDTESDVRVGSAGTVTVAMKNVGAEAANDTTVTLASQNSDLTFGKASEGTRYAGRWEPGETKRISYKVTAAKSAEQERYAFAATAKYDDPEGKTHTSRSLALGVTPRPEMSFALANVSSTLRVGNDGTLEGEVVNRGETTARDVVLQLTTDSQNVNPNEREYSVGSLAPGESAPFSFSVGVSDAAEGGPRQFSFVAKYRDAEGDAQQSDELLTRQRVAPQADTFGVSVSQDELTNGGQTELRVTVTNRANETVSDVSAKLFADSPISATGDQAYIQQLAPGESETIKFGVSASGAMTDKNYPVSMDFQYRDADGDTKLSDTYRRPVHVAASKKGGGGGLPLSLLAVGLVAVVGIAGYFRFR
ncbi:MAG: COG1361 S-layer family protein [Haloarculaceae archaeon]